MGQEQGGGVEAWLGQVNAKDTKQNIVRICYLEPEVKGAPVGRWQMSKTSAKRVCTADVHVSQVIAIITDKLFINDWMMSAKEWQDIESEVCFFSNDSEAQK